MFVFQFMFLAISMKGILANSLGSDSESLLRCSKFHFEEKVLEKVVRLEHKMEVYAEKIKLWEESISTSLNKVTVAKKQTETFVESMRDAHLKDQTRFNNSFDDVKKQTETFVDSMRDAHLKDQTRFDDLFDDVKKQTETFIDSMRDAHLKDQKRFNESFLGAVDRFKLQSENETEFYKREMNSLFDSFSSKVQELSEAESKRESTIKLSLKQEQNRFNESFDRIVGDFHVRFNNSLQEIALTQQKVALTACHTGSTVSSGTVVHFPTIKTNIGITDLSAYKSTGKFVCTVAGLYHVSAVMTSFTDGRHYYIYINNDIIETFYGKTGGSYRTGTRVFVTILDVGDEIIVRAGGSQYIQSHSCFTIVKLN